MIFFFRAATATATASAAMEAATALKAIANGAYYRNKMLVRKPAIDAIMPTLEQSTV